MNLKLLYQWTEELASHFPSFNSWQIDNLGLLSYGVVLAESCQQGQIARQISCGERVERAARRVRRFLDNPALRLEPVFAEWIRWVVAAMGCEAMTLLVDETKIGDRVAAMVVGVAWEGRCIPLAWRCYRANSAADNPAEGQVAMIAQLLTQVKAGLDPQTSVLVLADRGIGTSPKLCQQVQALGWDYLFRVTKQTKICTDSGDYTLAEMVQPGEMWAAGGKVFKKRGQLPAHARALWQAGCDEPWALVTSRSSLLGVEYGRRNWQEQSFRDLKSGGWQWGSSRIRHPDHMARLLLLLAVAAALEFIQRRLNLLCRVYSALHCLKFCFLPDSRCPLQGVLPSAGDSGGGMRIEIRPFCRTALQSAEKSELLSASLCYYGRLDRFPKLNKIILRTRANITSRICNYHRYATGLANRVPDRM